MRTKIQLFDVGKVPYKKHQDDACYDMYAAEITQVRPGLVRVRLGVAIQPPEGYRVAIYPRSSISHTGWSLANSLGVGDNNYTGEYAAVFQATPIGYNFRLNEFTYAPFPYKVGDRVCQMELVTYKQIDWDVVDTLDDTERGDGGFGSTGVK